jgi:hypothetical protein
MGITRDKRVAWSFAIFARVNSTATVPLLNEVCPHGVPLNISADGVEMFVVLYREMFVGSLVYVSFTHSLPMFSPSSCMGGGEDLHIGR